MGSSREYLKCTDTSASPSEILTSLVKGGIEHQFCKSMPGHSSVQPKLRPTVPERDGLTNTRQSHVSDLALDIVLLHLNRSEGSQYGLKVRT